MFQSICIVNISEKKIIIRYIVNFTLDLLFLQAIFDVVQPMLEALVDNKDIISAVAMIRLVDDFHISLNQAKKNILFHCLVLKGDSPNKSCKTYNNLLESYKDMIP